MFYIHIYIFKSAYKLSLFIWFTAFDQSKKFSALSRYIEF